MSTLLNKLSHNSRQIISNTAWLFVDRIFRMGFSLFVGVWAARYLGVEAFGQFNYAIAFVALLGAFATLGLDQILIRDLVREPAHRELLLGTAFALKLVGGTIALCVAIGSIVILRPHDSLMHWLVLIIAISMVFQSFDVIDFWFQSQVESKYSVWSKNLSFIFSNLGKIVFIQLKLPLIFFAWIYSAEFIMSALGLMIAYRVRGYLFTAWRYSFPLALRLLKDSWTLILSSFVIAIYMRIDQIMLGQMVGNEAVGVYSVAVKIAELWYFVPVAILSSVYPSIVEAKQISEKLYNQRLQKIMNLLTFLSYITALVISLSSSSAIEFLYGKEYVGASPILIIYVWASVFVSVGLVRSCWTTTEGLMQFAFLSAAIGAVINILLNTVLIKTYGGMGAAIATVISQAFASYLSSAVFPATRKIFIIQTRSLLFPNPGVLFKSESQST